MNKIFELTNRYIVLGTPLILFALITSIYLAVAAHGSNLSVLFALLLFFLMTSAFAAGWFNMVKTAVVEPERDEPNSLIKEFVPGVGEYFLSSLGALVIVFALIFLFVLLSTIVGMKLIGDPGISPEALSSAMSSQEALISFAKTITPEQALKLNQWSLLVLLFASFAYFIEMLHLPVIFFKNKNPFMAFFISLKDLFSRKFFKTLGIFVLIFVTYFVISVLSALFAANIFIHFFVTLLNFYFLTCASVGVFYYYNNNFIKSHLGQNIDTKI